MEERPDEMGGLSTDETTSLERLTDEQVRAAAEATVPAEGQEQAEEQELAEGQGPSEAPAEGEAPQEVPATDEEAPESPAPARPKRRPAGAKGRGGKGARHGGRRRKPAGDGRYIDSRIADQLQKMVDDCAAAGYEDVFINEAYRSHERQQEIWDTTYEEYLAEGYSEEEAYELTGQSVAVPGTSEHELGLAADICSIYFDEEYNAPIQTWLRENGWQYGFIQRYPEGKEAITGTKNENWHFRYVGVDAAKEMHDSGQTLEEYLGEVDMGGDTSSE